MKEAGMEKRWPVRFVSILWVLFWGFGMMSKSMVCQASDAVCAQVKIEINQELTLERQAFDAHMRINNGLTHISLEDVSVSVWFNDADGNAVLATSDSSDTSALFYIRVDEMTNISDVSGAGTVAPSTSADIHWLIIPSIGASNGLESGALYYVGATLTYTIGGESNTTEVSPDYIYVKPMPELTLDYFLPAEVYGDDAFTEAIEAPVPFSLGVRVKNSGQGTASELKIESAQPRIVENDQGLLIGFTIQGSQVNGETATDSLLVDFGDIAPGTSGTARWRMICTLSGEFVEFDADFSHSDELGGEVTSLLAGTETHTLVADVQVDLTGRDQILDFLALDEDVYRVYESDTVDTVVSDQSASSTLTHVNTVNGRAVYTLAAAVNAGFIYVHLTDPYGGEKEIASVVRSDGKTIKSANAWLSKSRDGQGWNHFINLFDAAGTGQYTLTFADAADTADAPVLQYISDVIAVEGSSIGFIIQASDADGTTPSLSAATLPAGASFTDRGDGTGTFAWTPAVGQAGTYGITFKASDGELDDSQRVTLTIRSITDTDGDGMDDAWEREQFGSIDRDGSGDYDGDGISDLDEYLAGSDPTAEDHAPSVPVIASPQNGDAVTTLTPELIIENSIDDDGDALAYRFEVYADDQYSEWVAEASVDEATGTTAWTLPGELDENGSYYWRVRATDGYSYSLWAYGAFRVNAVDESPDVPALAFPPDGGQVDTLTPTLAVTGIADPDDDEPACTFEVYADVAMTARVTGSGDLDPSDGAAGWTVDTPLIDGATYYWRAVITDSQGLSATTDLAAFTVNTANQAPVGLSINEPENGTEVTDTDVQLIVNRATDADGDSLGYYFEIDTDPGFDSIDKMASAMVEGQTDATVSWTLSGLTDNTTYYWRTRATDDLASSPWTVGRFFVNTANDAPSAPALKNPGQSAWVSVLTPQLCLAGGQDTDGDTLTYRFEVYADANLESLAAWSETGETTWTVGNALSDRATYYWRARATDEGGLEGNWSETGTFYVKEEEQPEPEAISVTVATDSGTALSGLKVYAYTASGSYAGLSATTDADGRASFDIDAFNAGTYQFRADYLGIQFWSAAMAIPDTTTIPIVIEQATVTVTVQSTAGAVTGARVYLYSASGSYLGVTLTSDANGQVVIDLPVGEAFLFRADVLGTRYWSLATTIAADTANAVIVDAGGGTLTVQVREDENTPMAGIRIYLFSEAKTYLNVYGTTDENGQVTFNVSEASYCLRADYLGYQFWSEAITVVTDTAEVIEIPHQSVRVSVQGCYQDMDTPVTGIKTYLFSTAGSYLNRYLLTDANGQAEFSLPEKEFMIRADYLNGKYWSDGFTWDDPQIVIPMGDARVNVTGAGLPSQGIGVYLFSDSGTYLNMNGTTDEAGQVTFRLPEGTYDFRIDYQGSQFWAADRQVAADTLTDVDVSVGGGSFGLSVVTDNDVAIDGVKCHVFDGDGTYLGLSNTTDADGQASFDLAAGDYRFRVDYLGNAFWSDTVTVSGDGSTTMIIDRSTVTVNVLAAGSVVTGTKVYLFSTAESYLGVYAITDDGGQAVFDLPDATDYRFRADVLGNHYWSDDVTVANGLDPVTIDAGGGTLQVTVQSDTGGPLAGLKTYLFNADGQYLSQSGETDASGQVSFDVPGGVYQVRADYLGYTFWSDAITVAEDAAASLTIALSSVTVSVVGSYQAVDTALPGIPVYLFTPTGTYLNINGKTDENGQLSFVVPWKPYMARVDTTGGQYWSDTFTASDTTVSIPMADAMVTVTGAGLPAAGVNVYLFSTAGTYLGTVQSTDGNGTVAFRLPAQTFKFRGDYQGNQYWSGDVTLEADGENDVLISVGGGSVTLTLETANGAPMSGVNCYVFSETGSYLGLKGSTGDSGQTSFDLADGTFQFRVDYLGYQYWSGAVTVPYTLVETMTIAHTDVTLTFQADYQGTIASLDGRKAYLFTPAGRYLGQYQETDAAGQAVFSLPDQAYTLRCDELGRHYWSDPVQSTDTTVTVAWGKAIIRATVGGESAENARVYLFSSTDSYLGRYESTDKDGSTEFLLPAGEYRFRVDLDGRQAWSDITTISADLEAAVTVELE
ncbi:carboxypeptidase regulatory-like domain-containing protein [Desulfosarcina ovata]|nr:carboxypeptidase regulatory-like domain-containing protein [Desulfosarcina ovata]